MVHIATQSIKDLGSVNHKDVAELLGGKVVTLDEDGNKKSRQGIAFRDWLFSLGEKDRLPRGKWFKGKGAGKPIFVSDELSSFMPSYDLMVSKSPSTKTDPLALEHSLKTLSEADKT